jgi:hypothetical protein
MTWQIAILEDDQSRIAEMSGWLAEALPEFDHKFFEDAGEMIQWLGENLRDVALIALDHDLPLRTIERRLVDLGTGRQVVDYLATISPTCPVLVHSSNVIAAQGMIAVLHKAGWEHARVHPHEDVAWVRSAWAEQVLGLLREFS